MHDHVTDIITGIPNENMIFYRSGNVWTFTDSKGNKYNIETRHSDIMPEWDGFCNRWYWVIIPIF